MSWTDFKTGSKKKKGLYFISLMLVLALFLSIYGIATATGTVGTIRVTPNPVNIGSNASISYSLSQSGKVYINVYDDSGVLVKNLLNGVSKAAGTNYQTWSTTGITDGSYRISIEERDNAGSTLGFGEITVQAGTPLTVTSVSVSPSVIGIGQSATVSYSLSKSANVTVVVLNKTGSTVRTLVSGAEQGFGSNSLPWDGMLTDGVTAAPDGDYTCKITATSGTSTVNATTGTITVEREAPRITGFTASPTPLKLTSQNLSISYNLSEDASVLLNVSDSSGVVRTVAANVYKNAGANTVSWDGTKDSGGYVPSGTYTVSITAVDRSGKSSGAPQTLEIKAGYAPAVTASIAPKIFKPGTESATISYSITVPATVTVEMMDSGIVVKRLCNEWNEAGSYTIPWDGLNAADKAYTYRITAVTAEGISTVFNSSDSVTVDAGPAQITGLTVSPSPYRLGNSSLVALNYTLSEDAAVTVNVYKDGAFVKNLVTGQLKNAGAGSVRWDGLDGDNHEVEGNYAFGIIAVDNEGWVSEASKGFAAGFRPAISGLTLTPPTVFNPPVDQAVYFNFNLDHDARVTLTITQNNGTVKTITNPLVPAGARSIYWDGTNNTGRQVADGPYDYKIDVVSPTVSTFSNSLSGTVTVEANDPVVSGITLSSTVVKIGTATRITYTLSEPATVTFKVYDANGNVVRELAPQIKDKSGIYTVEWDTADGSGTLITAGNYKLTAEAVDLFGKKGYSEKFFQAEKVPEITSVSVDPVTIDLSTGKTTATIYYTVYNKSNVTVKLLKSDGTTLKTLVSLKQTLGATSVVLDVYNGGNIFPSPLTYTIDATSIVGSFKAVKVTGNITITGTLPPGGPVNPPPPGPTSGCITCHKTYPAAHPMNNCYGCHGGNQPLLDCNSCHGWGAHSSSLLGQYGGHDIQVNGQWLGYTKALQCEDCHNAANAGKVPGHGDIPTLHTTTISNDCKACHNESLSVEHPLHKDELTNLAYDCNTCHQSTVAEVVYAIDNGIKDCAACHGTGIATGHENKHSAPGITSDCAKCHINSLLTEHLNNPITGNVPDKLSCASCHSSTVAEVVYAIDNSQSNCSACHTAASHDAVHTPTGINTGCTECHKDSLTLEHLNNPTTQADNSWTCATCHSSTVAEVVYAIDNNLKNCDACHTMSGHSQVHDTNNLDSNCLTCHNNNLSYEHLQNTKTQKDTNGNFAPKDCNACHASTEPTVAGAVYTGNTQCAACHRTGHNMSFVENVSTYVYKYPGFEWTPPQDALLWAGESWMPSEYVVGGKVIISNRRPATTDGVVDALYGPVFDYYNSRLTADNWTLTSPQPAQPDYFQVTYKKGIHQQTIWFYGGIGHQPAGDTSPGYRIEVIYK